MMTIMGVWMLMNPVAETQMEIPVMTVPLGQKIHQMTVGTMMGMVYVMQAMQMMIMMALQMMWIQMIIMSMSVVMWMGILVMTAHPEHLTQQMMDPI
jgi:hypothetical protein